jgi:hypothetical protein
LSKQCDRTLGDALLSFSRLLLLQAPPVSVFFVKEVVAGIKNDTLSEYFLSELFAASELFGGDDRNPSFCFSLIFFLSSSVRSSTTLHTQLLLCCAQRSAFSFAHHQHNLGNSTLES